jgi:hypothetical protein
VILWSSFTGWSGSDDVVERDEEEEEEQDLENKLNFSFWFSGCSSCWHSRSDFLAANYCLLVRRWGYYLSFSLSLSLNNEHSSLCLSLDVNVLKCLKFRIMDLIIQMVSSLWYSFCYSLEHLPRTVHWKLLDLLPWAGTKYPVLFSITKKLVSDILLPFPNVWDASGLH